jgi:aerobic-type carbon monoxide dehydrogenase small subunit (CoxS/CutS family)
MKPNLQIALTVNGEAAEASFAPYKTLLEVLREDLGLTGTKHGCELGECGACTVLLDGEPVLSCLVLGRECAGRGDPTSTRCRRRSWTSAARSAATARRGSS